ncbi:DUF4105 domain-containing protein [Flavobacterium sp. K5-23]|uniref:lipoprotein N-acyltransferase Lnb domain-containing protein n=1 Tax=Flavobacterium sp. K5-23 TaxID=2746225 RepID=UPI00200C97FC|nr:DUF4105 domain-containing protein [Flavobacterium sp. K5-23]UQD56172.1 DUF4105 domain-containing protein [Flavobacterium sp. K5-23]
MKISILKYIFSLTILLLTITQSYGQNITLSKNARVSVLTCGTGNESYSLFGHTAIRISDSDNNIDAVYNYGAFDFNTPNFVLKFTKGDLQYYAVVHSYSNFISEYTYEKRSVYEQELNISEDQKQTLFDNLNISLASGESHYTYKFIDKNCTSMVVDIINKTLQSKVIVKKVDTDKTYRSILSPYFDNHFYEKLGTSIIFGKKVDGYGTEIFLPFELLESLKRVQYNNLPLAAESKTIIEFDKIIPASWWNNCYTYLIFLVVIVLLNNKKVNASYLFIMGLLGVFFVFVGFYSFHKELALNYNVLLFNPSLLALLYFYFTKNKKWIYRFSLINILSLVVYLLILINKVHLIIVLPLILTSFTVLVKLAIQNKKRIPIII